MTVYCHRDKIIRVFQNIIENAGQALGGKGKICIETRDLNKNGQSRIEIIISNNGPPIPKEAIPNLFDPFFTKGKKHGTGLGLAICHKIISMHRGEICAESQPGKTSFIMSLPSYKIKIEKHKDEQVHDIRKICQPVKTLVRMATLL